MPTELGYFTMSVKDLDRARTFYGSLFDWQFEKGNAGERYAHINNTKCPFGFTSDGPGSFKHLYFRVDDIHAVITRVRELGGYAEEPTSSPSGLGATCRDDQGTEFSIWQPAEGY